MAKQTFKQSSDLKAQANNVRSVADDEQISDYRKNMLLATASTLESLDRARERRENESKKNIRELDVEASTNEVRLARRRQSVRIGTEVYLPSGTESTYGLPNALLRSALFSVAPMENQAECKHLLNAPIEALGDTVLKLTGYRLYDYDRQVFASLLSYYTGDRPLAADKSAPWVKSTYWQLAKILGVAYGPNVHKAIRSSLIRLNAACLRLRFNGHETPATNLAEVDIEDPCIDNDQFKCSTEILFRVPVAVAEWFGPTSWTAVPAAALTKHSGLPRWIAGYYSTHSKPYPSAIPDLYRYSGAECDLPEFRRRLKKALLKLQKPTAPDEIQVTNFNIDKDKVTVVLKRWNKLKS